MGTTFAKGGVALAIAMTMGVAPDAMAKKAPKAPPAPAYITHDSHFHLTNYIQEGTDIRDYLRTMMGDKVGRTAIFGIPLQQQWSHRVTGDIAPTYYLDTDAPLYYYSFTDAYIAQAYLSLPAEDRARLDPMITGFNPTDMYGADHVRRVLQTFPGVFSGIGEFSIHKEFVSSKIAGDVASLTDPALDRIFQFAGEAGLVAILHNDLAVPFPKAGKEHVYVEQFRDLLKRHPQTTIIWAHLGVGRVVAPVQGHLDVIGDMLKDPAFSHVYFDISWDQAAKYVLSSPEATAKTAAVINQYPDRFLFGTDEVAPTDQGKYLKVFYQYDPLWAQLSPDALQKVRKGNYERLFDAARVKVRAWEKANPAGSR